MKASEFDRRFDDNESVLDVLDLASARKLRTRQRITSRSVAVRQLPDSAKLAYTERHLEP